ncbi:hypothetical protein AMJ71_02695 [candidate division TA06 bacterium SM1_40]|uniref:DUF3857 domain-containing protein n=1 Tax=candidate division TA06 bacterium SM1_40 TaxID=1703773 RepID=A0A0S8JPF5_UNCT6|nr:MAG: hypothetical protein AMJ71_02695 [candidate division TA06 bacterium SM1_40]
MEWRSEGTGGGVSTGRHDAGKTRGVERWRESGGERGMDRVHGVIIALSLLAVLMALAGCGTRGWLPVAEISAMASDSPRYPDAGAVVILDEGKLRVLERGGESRFEHHRIIEVNDARGRGYAEVTIPYGGSSRVTDIRGRSISPDGSISLLDPVDIYDITLFPDYIFFSDARARRFMIPGVEVGSVIEYEYAIERRSPFPFDWWIQGWAPVARSTFQLTVPLGWLYDYRLYNLDISPVREVGEGRNVESFRWEIEQVPAIEPEPLMPPMSEVAAHISFSIADMLGYEITKSWDNLARWVNDLAEDRMGPDAAVEALALDLVADAEEEEERVRLLYEWVRDNIEYVAVEIGIGGGQPHPAPSVLQQRYGDCKDMAVLLIAMLRATGIEGSLVLVRTTDIGRFDETLPSLQFNHAIVLASLPSGEVWLDPTCTACPYGELPYVDLGAGALVVQGERGAVRQIGGAVCRANQTRTELEALLDPSGRLVCEGTVRMSGQPAIEARFDLGRLSPGERYRWLERYLAYRCPGVIVEEAEIGSLESSAEPLTLSFRFSIPSYAQKSEGSVFFLPDVLSQPVVTYPVATEERRYPVRLRYPETLSDRVVLKLPPGFEIETSPEVVTYHEPFGEFTCGVTIRDVEAVFTRRIAFLSERISREDHARLRTWLEEFARANRRIISGRLAYQRRGS